MLTDDVESIMLEVVSDAPDDVVGLFLAVTTKCSAQVTSRVMEMMNMGRFREV
jgi:hypothetical protein